MLTIKTTRVPLLTKASSIKLYQVARGVTLCSYTTSTTSHRGKAVTIPKNAAFFSSTSIPKEREYFPPPHNAPAIAITKPAWVHPVYSEAEMKAIQIAHRDAKTWSDKFALAMVRTMRWGMDFFTGYKHDHAVSIGEKSTSQANQEHRQTARYAMTEEKWLNRFVFLESVAGVPGFMASMVRHLSSLRRMERDNGWIETLQEEAYNERMHLLTFLPMIKPSWLMRMMIIGAQGVFANGMFIAYLISPRICHRFVGYLEEEAVITYSRAIADIENGKLPKWADPNFKIPEIAVRYWSMPEGKRTMRDLLLYVRADEAKHREVNHTLGNLEQHNDPNPFVSTYKDPSKPHPTKDLKDIRPTGWDREEIMGS